MRPPISGRGFLASVAALLSVGLPAAPAQTGNAPVTQGMSTSLTAGGRALWGLESLLRRVYGTAQVWSDAQDPSGIDFDCAGQICGPLASYDPYFYTFVEPTGTAFHIASSQYTNFGNYPIPVLVHGHNVACNADDSEFLVNLGDAAISSLQCVGPLSATSMTPTPRSTSARFVTRIENQALQAGADPESLVIPFTVTNTGTAASTTWCAAAARTAAGTEVTSAGASEVASSLAPGKTLSTSITILLVWTSVVQEPTVDLRCAASSPGVFAGLVPSASASTPGSVVSVDLGLQRWRARNFVAINQLEADLYPHYGLYAPSTSYDCSQLGIDLLTASHLPPPSYRPLAERWATALDAVRGQLRNCTEASGISRAFVADASRLDDVVFEIQDS